MTLKSGRTRVFRSKREQRQIVEETLKPGASVALVARTHGVNANHLFAWRRMYRDGQLESGTGASLLPVQISDAIAAKSQQKSKPIRRAVMKCVRAALQSLLR